MPYANLHDPPWGQYRMIYIL